MSRLKVTVPEYCGVPDGCRFTHETGHVSRAVTVTNLMPEVIRYRQQNNLPIPDDMREIVEDQLCRILPPGNCQYADGTEQRAFVDSRINFSDVAAGMSTLASVILNQRAVDQEEAERRAAICAACPANAAVTGCFGCTSLESTITAIVGAKKTKYDYLLKVCTACHCFNKAQVWIDARDLSAGASDGQMERLALFKDWCWKYNQIQEVRNEE